MMKKGPGGPRITLGPQPRDFAYILERRRQRAAPPPEEPTDGTVQEDVTEEVTARITQNVGNDGFNLTPEARIPGKHALNPPIVTIFGAGVAGLTAAHELVDRGFVVQVIEASEDPYCPGRPHIGGLAANQPARTRANVEDLHRNLIATALTPLRKNASAKERSKHRVSAWLLKVFAFNRSRWIQTETPARLHTSLFPQDAKDAETFQGTLLGELKKARDQYRERWLWDLSVRAVMLGIIKPSPPENPDAPPMDAARFVFGELEKAKTTGEIAEMILQYRLASQTADADLPSADELKAFAPLVRKAFEREFLCFRLVPYTRTGFAVHGDDVFDLHDRWAQIFSDDADLKDACLSTRPDPEDEEEAAAAKSSKHLRRGRDGVPLAVRTAQASPEFPHLVWLELEIVEQRLPGEHGYRFFPSFYHHLDDTMGRIPLYAHGAPTGRTVRDNLQPTVFQGIGISKADRAANGNVPDDADPVRPGCATRAAGTVIELARRRPQSFEALRDCTDRFVKRLGGTTDDGVLLLAKLTRYITASPERRRAVYEDKTWAEFLEVEKLSAHMQFHIRSASQALLAFSAAEADARTYGNVAIQMLLDELRDGTRVDRTLNGPTSDAWLEPWREHLERQGVRFFRGAIKGLKLEPREDGTAEMVPDLDIADWDRLSPQASPLLAHDLKEPALKPDFYVLALNVEQSRKLAKTLAAKIEKFNAKAKDDKKVSLAKDAPDLRDLLAFGESIDGKVAGEKPRGTAMREMTGVQYFFDAKTDIGRGHMYFPYSRWGLSSITQSEFWSDRGGFADGYFGLLSVDVCTTGALQAGTTAEPRDDLPFFECLETKRPEEGSLRTARAALAQITARLPAGEKVSEPRCFHVDSLLFPTKLPPKRYNHNEPKPRFLASLAKLDKTRPGRPGACVGAKEIEYRLAFDRWVLCGTFMATHTRMTTMEAANESARHAVAAILARLQDPPTTEPALDINIGGHGYQIENLANKTYNWASKKRAYEKPEIWNPEDDELEDLDFFRRVDRRLMELGLPHFMDIVKFDQKLEHALQAAKLYGEVPALKQLLGAGASTIDAALTRELGQGYAERELNRLKGEDRLRADTAFSNLNVLDGHWNKLLEEITKLIRSDRAAGATGS